MSHRLKHHKQNLQKKGNKPPSTSKGKEKVQEKSENDSDEFCEEEIWRLFKSDYAEEYQIVNEEVGQQERENAEKN